MLLNTHTHTLALGHSRFRRYGRQEIKESSKEYRRQANTSWRACCTGSGGERLWSLVRNNALRRRPMAPDSLFFIRLHRPSSFFIVNHLKWRVKMYWLLRDSQKFSHHFEPHLHGRPRWRWNQRHWNILFALSHLHKPYNKYGKKGVSLWSNLEPFANTIDGYDVNSIWNKK